MASGAARCFVALRHASHCCAILESRPHAALHSPAPFFCRPSLKHPRPVTSRKQISMVLPADLIAAIKLRATQRGQSITAYITALVRADLGEPPLPDVQSLAAQVLVLQERMDQMEQQAIGGESDPDIHVEPL